MTKRSKRFYTTFFMSDLALALICAAVAFAAIMLCAPHVSKAAVPPNHLFHVSGAPLPLNTAASPIPIEGTSLATNVDVDFLVLSNPDTASHTVTVEDCQSTPFVLYNAYTIAAGTTWTVPLGSMLFQGCFKWAASNVVVTGALVGTR